MMRTNFRTAFGTLLILAGALLMLQRLDILGGQWDDAVLTLVYGFGVVYFAAYFLDDRSRWWAALLTFVLLGFTIGNLFEIFLPGRADSFIGSLVLFLIGFGFLAVYLVNREQWWAIIPGGVMLSLSALTVFEELPLNLAFEPAGILFVGMGITFLVLYFLPVDGPRLTWAIYPAVPLIVFGLFVGFEQEQIWDYIWPALVILLGVYFLFSALRRQQDA